MLTPGHAILNCAILSETRKKAPFTPIIWGAIVPDLSMLFFFLWNRFVLGIPSKIIFGTLYFTPEWMAFFDVFHSFPLIGAALVISRIKKLRRTTYFFASMFLHSLFDLPLHNSDAHRHFFPLSLYKFNSPFSYWDPKHYGSIMTIVELILVVILSIRLWPKVHSRVGHGLIVLVNILYITSALFHKM